MNYYLKGRMKKQHKVSNKLKKVNFDDDLYNDVVSDDEIIIPLNDDIFDKNTFYAEIIFINKNMKIYYFPNEILMGESSESSESEDTNDIVEIEEKSICETCGAEKNLVEDNTAGAMICANCGILNRDILDYGPEWRQYNNEDNKSDNVSRCGCPTNIFFPSLSQGTIMSGVGNKRLNKKQKWSSTHYKEKSLNDVFTYILNICLKNNISKSVADSAKILYKKFKDCKHQKGPNVDKQIIIRGKNRTSIIAACVYKSCELNKEPRRVKEIAEFFNLEKKKITCGIRYFDEIMGNITENIVLFDNFITDISEDYIRRYSPKLMIKKKYMECAIRVSYNSTQMKIASDHNPLSIAAGSIYAVIQYYNLAIEKKKVAKIFGTSDVTISKIVNKIYEYIEIIIDNELTAQIIKKFEINE